MMPDKKYTTLLHALTKYRHYVADKEVRGCLKEWGTPVTNTELLKYFDH